MALRGKIIDLFRLDLLDDSNQVGRIRKVTVVQAKLDALLVRILVEMIDAIRVERRCTALDAVDLVAFFQEEFRKVRAVLPCNAGN